MREPTNSAGDPFPRNCELIEVHVAELKQLFNAIDPSPFRERDLDRQAGLPEEPAIRLSDRLSAMPVRIAYKDDASSGDAWRWDWPAVPASARPSPGTDARRTAATGAV